MKSPDYFTVGDKKFVPEPPPPSEPEPQLFRVLHDFEIFAKGIIDPRNSEGVWYWRKGMPEVFNFTGSHVTKMVQWVQELAFDLNPGMPTDHGGFRYLYDVRRAFSNGTGFDTVHQRNEEDYAARKDFINKWDLDAREYPRFDKSRTCGGATIAGKVDGDSVIVETLKVGSPPGNDRIEILGYVLKHPWLFFHAVTVAGSSTNTQEIVGKFPQNRGNSVLVPLVTTTVVRYPLSWLEPVTRIADPYKVG